MTISSSSSFSAVVVVVAGAVVVVSRLFLFECVSLLMMTFDVERLLYYSPLCSSSLSSLSSLSSSSSSLCVCV
tara:strand:- start:180 stop:398 length:219 start_codon:yes stop_codon:yes gene_type:complete